MEKNKSDILSQVAAFGMHNDVRMLIKAAEIAKSEFLTLTAINEDNVNMILQREMENLKFQSLKTMYPRKEVVITGNLTVDTILLDVQKLDFSKLDELEDGVEYITYTTKILILKYMIDEVLNTEEEMNKAKQFLGDEESLRTYLKMTKEELKEEFIFNKFLCYFHFYLFDELQAKYYLEAIYINVNQFENLYDHNFCISELNLIQYLENKAIEYVKIMTEYDEEDE